MAGADTWLIDVNLDTSGIAQGLASLRGALEGLDEPTPITANAGTSYINTGAVQTVGAGGTRATGDMRQIVSAQAETAALMQSQLVASSRLVGQQVAGLNRFSEQYFDRLKTQIRGFDYFPAQQQAEVGRVFQQAFAAKASQLSSVLDNIRIADIGTQFVARLESEARAITANSALIGSRGPATSNAVVAGIVPSSRAGASNGRLQAQMDAATRKTISSLEAYSGQLDRSRAQLGALSTAQSGMLSSIRNFGELSRTTNAGQQSIIRSQAEVVNANRYAATSIRRRVDQTYNQIIAVNLGSQPVARQAGAAPAPTQTTQTQAAPRPIIQSAVLPPSGTAAAAAVAPAAAAPIVAASNIQNSNNSNQVFAPVFAPAAANNFRRTARDTGGTPPLVGANVPATPTAPSAASATTSRVVAAAEGTLVSALEARAASVSQQTAAGIASSARVMAAEASLVAAMNAKAASMAAGAGIVGGVAGARAGAGAGFSGAGIVGGGFAGRSAPRQAIGPVNPFNNVSGVATAIPDILAAGNLAAQRRYASGGVGYGYNGRPVIDLPASASRPAFGNPAFGNPAKGIYVPQSLTSVPGVTFGMRRSNESAAGYLGLDPDRARFGNARFDMADFVAQQDGRVIGSSSLIMPRGVQGFKGGIVDNVAVAPQFRGTGLASALSSLILPFQETRFGGRLPYVTSSLSRDSAPIVSGVSRNTVANSWGGFEETYAAELLAQRQAQLSQFSKRVPQRPELYGPYKARGGFAGALDLDRLIEEGPGASIVPFGNAAQGRVPASTAIKRNRVGNIGDERLMRRRSALAATIAASDKIPTRMMFAMRAAEMHAVEKELLSRGVIDTKFQDIDAGVGPQRVRQGGYYGNAAQGRRTIIGPENVPMQFAAPVPDLISSINRGRDWSGVRAVSPGIRGQISSFYQGMPSMDRSPSVQASYGQLAKEINQQYEILTKGMGVNVQPTRQDPYADFFQMQREFTGGARGGARNLRVFKSNDGDHPFFSGETNTRFRAIHDAFGHLATGRGFDRHGEEAAYQAHSRTFSPLARRALATDLRAQTASLIDSGGVFQEQKVGFIPRHLRGTGFDDSIGRFGNAAQGAVLRDSYENMYGSARVAPSGYISNLMVRPEKRGQGYGTDVMRQIIADADAGKQSLSLSARDELQPFYERLGFQRTTNELFGQPLYQRMPEARGRLSATPFERWTTPNGVDLRSNAPGGTPQTGFRVVPESEYRSYLNQGMIQSKAGQIHTSAVPQRQYPFDYRMGEGHRLLEIDMSKDRFDAKNAAGDTAGVYRGALPLDRIRSVRTYPTRKGYVRDVDDIGRFGNAAQGARSDRAGLLAPMRQRAAIQGLYRDNPIIGDMFRAYGNEPVYPVGGPIRDALRGIKPNDIDFTTPVLPERSQQILRRGFPQGSIAGDAGMKHGTAVINVPKVGDLEVTTHRFGTANEKGDVKQYTTSLREDLARRDFTVNAMAADQQGRLIDPFGGVRDLRNQTIRAVGDPAQRFAEDPLRIVRAQRQAATFGPGWKIDPATVAGAQQVASRLPELSRERFNLEMGKILKSDEGALGRSLAFGDQLGSNEALFGPLLPGARALAGIPGVSPSNRLAGMMHLAGINPKDLSGEGPLTMRLPKDETQRAVRINSAIRDRQAGLSANAFVRRYTDDEITAAGQIVPGTGRGLESALDIKDQLRQPLPITGNDLKGTFKGRDIKTALDKAEAEFAASGGQLTRDQTLAAAGVPQFGHAAQGRRSINHPVNEFANRGQEILPWRQTATGFGDVYKIGSAKKVEKRTSVGPDFVSAANRPPLAKMVANLNTIAMSASDQLIADGMDWYPRVNRMIASDVRGTGLTVRQGAGMVASLSPNMEFEGSNVNAIEQVMNLRPQDWRLIEEDLNRPVAKGERRTRSEATKAMLAERAPSVSSATNEAFMQARQIIRGIDPLELMARVGAPKTRSFFQNLDDPYGLMQPRNRGFEGFVNTQDGRQSDMAVNSRRDWGYGRGISSNKGYSIFERATNRAASIIPDLDPRFEGILPNQFQAVSWLTGQGIERLTPTLDGLARTSGVPRIGQKYFQNDGRKANAGLVFPTDEEIAELNNRYPYGDPYDLGRRRRSTGSTKFGSAAQGQPVPSAGGRAGYRAREAQRLASINNFAGLPSELANEMSSTTGQILTNMPGLVDKIGRIGTRSPLAGMTQADMVRRSEAKGLAPDAVMGLQGQRASGLYEIGISDLLTPQRVYGGIRSGYNAGGLNAGNIPAHEIGHVIEKLGRGQTIPGGTPASRGLGISAPAFGASAAGMNEYWESYGRVIDQFLPARRRGDRQARSGVLLNQLGSRYAAESYLDSGSGDLSEAIAESTAAVWTGKQIPNVATALHHKAVTQSGVRQVQAPEELRGFWTPPTFGNAAQGAGRFTPTDLGQISKFYPSWVNHEDSLAIRSQIDSVGRVRRWDPASRAASLLPPEALGLAPESIRSMLGMFDRAPESTAYRGLRMSPEALSRYVPGYEFSEKMSTGTGVKGLASEFALGKYGYRDPLNPAGGREPVLMRLKGANVPLTQNITDQMRSAWGHLQYADERLLSGRYRVSSVGQGLIDSESIWGDRMSGQGTIINAERIGSLRQFGNAAQGAGDARQAARLAASQQLAATPTRDVQGLFGRGMTAAFAPEQFEQVVGGIDRLRAVSPALFENAVRGYQDFTPRGQEAALATWNAAGLRRTDGGAVIGAPVFQGGFAPSAGEAFGGGLIQPLVPYARNLGLFGSMDPSQTGALSGLDLTSQAGFSLRDESGYYRAVGLSPNLLGKGLIDNSLGGVSTHEIAHTGMGNPLVRRTMERYAERVGLSEGTVDGQPRLVRGLDANGKKAPATIFPSVGSKANLDEWVAEVVNAKASDVGRAKPNYGPQSAVGKAFTEFDRAVALSLSNPELLTFQDAVATGAVTKWGAKVGPAKVGDANFQSAVAAATSWEDIGKISGIGPKVLPGIIEKATDYSQTAQVNPPGRGFSTNQRLVDDYIAQRGGTLAQAQKSIGVDYDEAVKNLGVARSAPDLGQQRSLGFTGLYGKTLERNLIGQGATPEMLAAIGGQVQAKAQLFGDDFLYDPEQFRSTVAAAMSGGQLGVAGPRGTVITRGTPGLGVDPRVADKITRDSMVEANERIQRQLDRSAARRADDTSRSKPETSTVARQKAKVKAARAAQARGDITSLNVQTRTAIEAGFNPIAPGSSPEAQAYQYAVAGQMSKARDLQAQVRSKYGADVISEKAYEAAGLKAGLENQAFQDWHVGGDGQQYNRGALRAQSKLARITSQYGLTADDVRVGGYQRIAELETYAATNVAPKTGLDPNLVPRKALGYDKWIDSKVATGQSPFGPNAGLNNVGYQGQAALGFTPPGGVGGGGYGGGGGGYGYGTGGGMGFGGMGGGKNYATGKPSRFTALRQAVRGDDSLGGYFAGGALQSMKYALPSMLLFGAASGIAGALKEAEELKFALARLDSQLAQTFGEEAAGKVDAIKQSIIDLSKQTGVGADEIAKMEIAIRGAFQGETLTGADGSQISGEGLIKEQREAAAKLAVVADLPTKVIGDQLTAVGLSFGVSNERVGDITTNLASESGVDVGAQIEFLSSIAPIADQAGFTIEEISAIGATIAQTSGRTGGGLAEQLGRVLPAVPGNKDALLQLAYSDPGFGPDFIDALREGTTSDVFKALPNSLPNITAKSEESLYSLLGSRREAGAVIAAFAKPDNTKRFQDSAEESQGSLDTRFERQKQTLTTQLKVLGEQFRTIMVYALDAGLEDMFKVLIDSLKLLVTVVAPVAQIFSKLNEALGGAPAKILGAVAAWKLLQTVIHHSGAVMQRANNIYNGTSAVALGPPPVTSPFRWGTNGGTSPFNVDADGNLVPVQSSANRRGPSSYTPVGTGGTTRTIWRPASFGEYRQNIRNGWASGFDGSTVNPNLKGGRTQTIPGRIGSFFGGGSSGRAGSLAIGGFNLATNVAAGAYTAAGRFGTGATNALLNTIAPPSIRQIAATRGVSNAEAFRGVTRASIPEIRAGIAGAGASIGRLPSAIAGRVSAFGSGIPNAILNTIAPPSIRSIAATRGVSNAEAFRGVARASLSERASARAAALLDRTRPMFGPQLPPSGPVTGTYGPPSPYAGIGGRLRRLREDSGFAQEYRRRRTSGTVPFSDQGGSRAASYFAGQGRLGAGFGTLGTQIGNLTRSLGSFGRGIVTGGQAALPRALAAGGVRVRSGIARLPGVTPFLNELEGVRTSAGGNVNYMPTRREALRTVTGRAIGGVVDSARNLGLSTVDRGRTLAASAAASARDRALGTGIRARGIWDQITTGNAALLGGAASTRFGIAGREAAQRFGVRARGAIASLPGVTPFLNERATFRLSEGGNVQYRPSVARAIGTVARQSRLGVAASNLGAVFAGRAQGGFSVPSFTSPLEPIRQIAATRGVSTTEALRGVTAASLASARSRIGESAAGLRDSVRSVFRAPESIRQIAATRGVTTAEAFRGVVGASLPSERLANLRRSIADRVNTIRSIPESVRQVAATRGVSNAEALRGITAASFGLGGRKDPDGGGSGATRRTLGQSARSLGQGLKAIPEGVRQVAATRGVSNFTAFRQVAKASVGIGPSTGAAGGSRIGNVGKALGRAGGAALTGAIGALALNPFIAIMALGAAYSFINSQVDKHTEQMKAVAKEAREGNQKAIELEIAQGNVSAASGGPIARQATSLRRQASSADRRRGWWDKTWKGALGIEQNEGNVLRGEAARLEYLQETPGALGRTEIRQRISEADPELLQNLFYETTLKDIPTSSLYSPEDLTSTKNQDSLLNKYIDVELDGSATRKADDPEVVAKARQALQADLERDPSLSPVLEEFNKDALEQGRAELQQRARQEQSFTGTDTQRGGEGRRNWTSALTSFITSPTALDPTGITGRIFGSDGLGFRGRKEWKPETAAAQALLESYSAELGLDPGETISPQALQVLSATDRDAARQAIIDEGGSLSEKDSKAIAALEDREIIDYQNDPELQKIVADREAAKRSRRETLQFTMDRANSRFSSGMTGTSGFAEEGITSLENMRTGMYSGDTAPSPEDLEAYSKTRTDFYASISSALKSEVDQALQISEIFGASDIDLSVNQVQAYRDLLENETFKNPEQRIQAIQGIMEGRRAFLVNVASLSGEAPQISSILDNIGSDPAIQESINESIAVEFNQEDVVRQGIAVQDAFAQSRVAEPRKGDAFNDLSDINSPKRYKYDSESGTFRGGVVGETPNEEITVSEALRRGYVAPPGDEEKFVDKEDRVYRYSKSRDRFVEKVSDAEDAKDAPDARTLTRAEAIAQGYTPSGVVTGEGLVPRSRERFDSSADYVDYVTETALTGNVLQQGLVANDIGDTYENTLAELESLQGQEGDGVEARREELQKSLGSLYALLQLLGVAGEYDWNSVLGGDAPDVTPAKVQQEIAELRLATATAKETRERNRGRTVARAQVAATRSGDDAGLDQAKVAAAIQKEKDLERDRLDALYLQSKVDEEDGVSAEQRALNEATINAEYDNAKIDAGIETQQAQAEAAANAKAREKNARQARVSAQAAKQNAFGDSLGAAATQKNFAADEWSRAVQSVKDGTGTQAEADAAEAAYWSAWRSYQDQITASATRRFRIANSRTWNPTTIAANNLQAAITARNQFAPGTAEYGEADVEVGNAWKAENEERWRQQRGGYSLRLATWAGGSPTRRIEADLRRNQFDQQVAVIKGDGAEWAALIEQQQELERQLVLNFSAKQQALGRLFQALSKDSVVASEIGVSMAKLNAGNIAKVYGTDSAEYADALTAIQDAEKAARAALNNRTRQFFNLYKTAGGEDSLKSSSADVQAARAILARAKRGGDMDEILDAQIALNQAEAARRQSIRSRLETLSDLEGKRKGQDRDPVQSSLRNINLYTNLLADAQRAGDIDAALGYESRLIDAQRQAAEAMQDVRMSAMELRAAELNAMEDEVGAAQVARQQAQEQLDFGVSQGLGESEINRLRANAINADKQAQDAVYNDRLDEYRYMLEMNDISKSTYMAHIKNLQGTVIPGSKKFKELELELKRLKDDMSSDLSVNMPSTLGLPTVYEIRRMNQQTNYNAGSSPVGYTDVRQLNINGTMISNGMDFQAFVDTLAQFMGVPGTSGNAPKHY